MIRGVPYDHQLEYIECTDNSVGYSSKHITSLVCFDGRTDAIELECAFTSTRQYGTIIGCNERGISVGGGRFNVRRNGSSAFFNIQGPSFSSLPLVTGEWYHIQVAGQNNGGSLVNDVVGSFAQADAYVYTKPYFIFAGYDFSSPNWGGDAKIKYIRHRRNGVVIQDLIPVSVNGVAMMYDRVTGTFPKHYGTFVAGPVASTPLMGVHMYPQVYTAADYVQDGLVAIWDGIENAGWGQHDESPHFPVNLVDGQPLSINGDVEIGSNYFKFGAGEWGYSTIQDFASAVASKSFTVEIVAKNDKVANAGIVSIGSRGVWLYADSSNNIQTLNILSSTYTPSPSIQFKSSDLWHATIQGGVTPHIIVNGRTISAQYGTQTSVSSSVFYIGSLQGNSSWSNGTLWCGSVRLYSRNLTASEKAHNDLVDKIRYNVPIAGA